MTTRVETFIAKCIGQCLFYRSAMGGMECGHPEFRGVSYGGFIITHGQDIPDKCPLRNGTATIKISLLDEDLVK